MQRADNDSSCKNVRLDYLLKGLSRVSDEVTQRPYRNTVIAMGVGRIFSRGAIVDFSTGS